MHWGYFWFICERRLRDLALSLLDRGKASDVAGFDISALAFSRLGHFVDLLNRWQGVQNLVSPETLEAVWWRHIADSLQLIRLMDSLSSADCLTQREGIDLGSGAGLPGLIVALATADRSDGLRYDMTLVESNNRKASFLRTVSRETGVQVSVLAQRIEHVKPVPKSFVTSRALAPIAILADLASGWLNLVAIGLFHKGGEIERELANWSDAACFAVVNHPSISYPNGRILEVRSRET